MGSFRASLELGGKEFDVLQTEYVFSRDTDKKGKIASNVYGGRINITIESTADTSVIEAMLNSQFKAIEGKVIYKKSEEDSKMKEIEFKNAYIVYYKENLDVNGILPMVINFTISAEEMSIGTAAIDNRWPSSIMI
ncbi:type VI secretion system tube protein TssD (plasmid) [Tenacibaculum finnmarkense]|nr:type VI secretion system tube protein TssD [Tenacibaculum finnmarkense]